VRSRRDKPELKEARENLHQTSVFQKIRELLKEAGNVTAGQQAAALTRLAGRLAGQAGFSRSFSTDIYRQGYQDGKGARERAMDGENPTESQKPEEPTKES